MNQVRRERISKSLLCRIIGGCLLLAPVYPDMHVAADAPPVHTQEPTVISRMQNNQASLQLVMDRFSSDDKAQRREAATAIVALRQHYLDSLQNHLESSYRGEHSAMMQHYLLRALAQLRPTSPPVIEGAIAHFGSYWSPTPDVSISSGRWSDDKIGRPAPYVVVFSSLPALPSLAKNIAVSPLPEAKKDWDEHQDGLRSALTILGGGTAAWLARESANAPDEVSRAALKKASQFTATQIWQPETGQGIMPALSGFSPALWITALNGMRSGDVLSDQTPPDSFLLKWNAADDLAKSSPSKGHYKEVPNDTKYAFAQMMKPFPFIEYHLMLRITKQPKDAVWPYKPFSPAAQTDAIRVLGCMRSAVAGPMIWERLRAKARTKPLDQDKSEDTAACLRALGQMDVPMAHFLTKQIALLTAQDQQLATAYMLSKIMGRYSVYWIQQEINKYKRDSEWSKDDKGEVQYYTTSIKRLQNALKVGTEKKWFEGEYYGYNDPQAYDLVFPTAKPKARD